MSPAMKSISYVLICLLFFSISCKKEKAKPSKVITQGPVAKIISDTLTMHGDNRIDDYFWMRLSDEQKNAPNPDAQAQDVLDYINAENDYLDTTMGHTKNLQKKVNVNLNFAIRFLIQNNIEYEIHTSKKSSSSQYQKELLALCKKINADLILITTTKHLSEIDYIFGEKEQHLISNSEKIPVMCVNPKSNFAKVGQFMYG